VTEQGFAYRRFWADVGEQFPDLGGAASTRYYADNERRLFAEHFPDLGSLRVFKTDLWDEAKNTRILAWAAEKGARVFGVDISEPTVGQARAAFPGDALRAAVSDVRALPFRDASFDAIYSMGTIEHFDETERAVAEIARVLKPGGRAIVGVPNRHDPFLRPLLSTALQALGLYAYGFEKSYSRRALRRMLEAAGLAVVAETAIFFIPGWLRMLDLACHSWCRPLATVTGALVWPFVLLDRHLPAVRRHGYLLATVVTKPARVA
jgi:SAM-dependent methyltransferase